MTRAWFTGLLVCVLASTPVFSQQSEPAIDRVGDDGVTAPLLLESVEPAYTPQARAGRVQGFVFVEVIVREDGTVTDATIVKSQLLSYAGAGDSKRPTPFLTGTQVAAFGLDARALEAARQATFRPGTRDGTPVPVRLTMELQFTLQPEKRARARR